MRQPEAPPPVLVQSPTTIPGPLAGLDWTAPEPEAAESFPPVAALYLTGEALSALFFGAAYLWNLRRFWDAVPAEGELIRHWQETHPTLLPVQIKVSRAVRAPLAYGLLQPVILLPANTCCSDEEHLTCILTHEYVHIRRGDMVWKLLLAAALCVHWFNPLVWAMYFCANRDLELACDEAVVRTLGLDRRKDYAYALLSAAERGFFPLCAPYTTQDHMEERIQAIMKIKKTSFGTILTAILLVTGITAVFATSRAPVPRIWTSLSRAMTRPHPPPRRRKGTRVPMELGIPPAKRSSPGRCPRSTRKFPIPQGRGSIPLLGRSQTIWVSTSPRPRARLSMPPRAAW